MKIRSILFVQNLCNSLVSRHVGVETLVSQERLCVRVFVHTQLCPKLCDLMDCRPPGFLAIEFSRQEYWSELPFPTPGDLPDPGIEPTCPALAGRFFTTESPGKP